MIKIAQVKHPNFTFKQGSAQKIPFEDANFDLIICSASFHHFPSPEAFLAEAKRLLAPEVNWSSLRFIFHLLQKPIIGDLINFQQKEM